MYKTTKMKQKGLHRDVKTVIGCLFFLVLYVLVINYDNFTYAFSGEC